MKHIVRITIVVALFALLPAALWAQDEELTLAGLAEQLAALTDRVTAVEAKLEPLTTDGGVCVQYADGQLQRETVTKYLDTFDENIESSHISLDAVHYNTEEGLTIYHFSQLFADRTVTETWRGCEFLDVGEWEEDE